MALNLKSYDLELLASNVCHLLLFASFTPIPSFYFLFQSFFFFFKNIVLSRILSHYDLALTYNLNLLLNHKICIYIFNPVGIDIITIL
jgi:hypothetical protein